MEKKLLLSVKKLSISFNSNNVLSKAVNSISFDVYENEIVGVIGESGSGKSVTALSLMRLIPFSEKTKFSGTVTYKGMDIKELSEKEIQSVRGREIAMVFQEPMSALNPSMTCGSQVREILLHHDVVNKKDLNDEVLRLFNSVKIPDAHMAVQKYPHELSGGQQQRVMIAMAIACKPKILIADEPTTALDVTVQKEIIALLSSLQKETKMSIIFISHDLALVSEISNRILVMYKGKIIENGDTNTVLKTPKEPYTKALISAKPKTGKRLKRLPTIKDILSGSNKLEIITKKEREKRHKKIYNSPPILRVENLEKIYFKRYGLFSGKTSFKAIDNVSFKLFEGETLGLVGESGCGKSSLGNAILQLNRATSGSVFYKGKNLHKLSKKDLRHLRKEIQIIFQDPLASLNPRLTIGKAIIEPMVVHKLYDNYSCRKSKALDILEKVGIDKNSFDRYPHEFSGGQRQRIVIARTIAVEPKLIICDESVSALDLSVQAQVLNLLNSLKDDFKFTYIFISHDLAVVKHMSDKILVMNNGKIEEQGDADEVYKNPKQKYTKRLISAIPKEL
ncbi:MAG: ABC transporter ATP-binding protein [Flavobacteriaceae bacterium]|nr:ABC transporter ATP-binding protein [Flavobacteriaceae bacterium]